VLYSVWCVRTLESQVSGILEYSYMTVFRSAEQRATKRKKKEKKKKKKNKGFKLLPGAIDSGTAAEFSGASLYSQWPSSRPFFSPHGFLLAIPTLKSFAGGGG
jgi:hypothetical protein